MSAKVHFSKLMVAVRNKAFWWVKILAVASVSALSSFWIKTVVVVGAGAGSGIPPRGLERIPRFLETALKLAIVLGDLVILVMLRQCVEAG